MRLTGDSHVLWDNQAVYRRPKHQDSSNNHHILFPIGHYDIPQHDPRYHDLYYSQDVEPDLKKGTSYLFNN